MGDINSFTGVVKILETPKQYKLSETFQFTEFRVQFPQVRRNQTSIINLVLWGKFGYESLQYYKINDYVLLEGYVSLKNKKNALSFATKEITKIQVTVLKIYPFNLNSTSLKNSKPNF